MSLLNSFATNGGVIVSLFPHIRQVGCDIWFNSLPRLFRIADFASEIILITLSRLFVRGLAVNCEPIDRPAYRVAIRDCVNLAVGSSIRGIAGGLFADVYDWRTRNHVASPPTLEFLRLARDHNEDLDYRKRTRPDG